jgi:hypothetical protein
VAAAFVAGLKERGIFPHSNMAPVPASSVAALHYQQSSSAPPVSSHAFAATLLPMVPLPALVDSASMGFRRGRAVSAPAGKGDLGPAVSGWQGSLQSLHETSLRRSSSAVVGTADAGFGRARQISAASAEEILAGVLP